MKFAAPKWRRRILGLAAFVWIWIALIPAPLAAQAITPGTVSGHVRGPGGVAVPGATVQFTNLGTGERKQTWTDEAGNYVLSGLSPGNYKLEVSLLGLQTDVREPVPVTEGKTLVVNVALVFTTPATANPTPERTLPESVQAAQRPSLPLRGNEQSQATETSGNGNEGSLRFSGEPSAGGAPQAENSAEVEADASASAANSFLLSGGTGISASTPGGEPNQRGGRFPRGPGGMGEGQVPGFGGGGFGGGGFGGPMGGGFGPGGFGGGPGGGGGNWARNRARVNRLRGNFFEQYTNSALDAHPYPLNITQSPQIPAYSQQFGGSIGGPLAIPKVYNGGNKTSFFVNYQLQRSKNPFDSYGTVPTLAERAGDFSQALIPSGPQAGTVAIIYDPSSNPAGPRTPFPGNVIPASRMDKAALGLLPYIPWPNLPGSVQNFHLQESLPSSNDRVMGRIGHQISTKDSINGMYFFNSSRSESVSVFPTLTSTSSIRGQNLNLTEIHTFGPRTVNTLTANFSRQRASTLNPFAYKQDIAGELGIQGVSTNPLDWGLPSVQFTNFSALNLPIPALTRNQTFRVVDFFLRNVGKHNIRMGGELRRVQINTLTDPNARGTFTFSGYTTSDFTSRGLPLRNTGFDFADFLLGLPQTTSVRFGESSSYFRSWVYSGFFQDDWRVAAHLTINYGLRYEYFTPFTEKYGHLADLAFGPGFSSAAVVTGQNPGSLPNSLLRGDTNNLAPRVGLAFRPWSQHTLVLRAGYGIFYDGSIYSRIFPNMASQPPFAQASTLLTTPKNVLTLENGFPQLGPNILTNTYAVDPNFRTPYAQTWNFSIEDEIARNLIFSLGYVGTKGTKLDLLLAPNQSAPGSPLTSGQQLALQNALAFTYETSGAASIYHGLQVGLRRQFHGGFSMSGTYTFSKSIDDAGSVGGAGRSVVQNYLDLAAERGLSSFDVRHRLLINHTYEFPFGEQRRWFHQGGALARVAGNWQLSGTTTIHSGTPYTATVLGNLSNRAGTAAISNLRANATGQPVELPSFERTPQKFFNTAAFTLPDPGEFGDAGRNTIPGPGLVNFNMSLDKLMTFSREKGIRGDFRISSSNIFNTPAFSGLATVVNGQGFGRAQSVGTMRTLTFSLRVRF
jgi:hypothetical protein